MPCSILRPVRLGSQHLRAGKTEAHRGELTSSISYSSSAEQSGIKLNALLSITPKMDNIYFESFKESVS